MSAVRLEKLKGLLNRVQERRGQPRLSAVAPVPKTQDAEANGAALLESAEVPTAAHEISPVLRPEPPAKPVEVEREDVQRLAHAPTLGNVPPAVAKAPEPAAPPAVAKAAEPSAPPPVVPAEAKAPVVEEALPEVEPAAEVARVEEAPLTAPSARVEPLPMASSKPVVRAVSAPVVETPKTFGDLLELSLSLRPRA
jgi:hypothetical protein